MRSFDPTGWLRERIEPGDLVLTGSRDLVSLLLQAGTSSHVSHVAIAIDTEHVVEAYDYGFTPIETDEGVYQTTLNQLVTRSPRIDRIVIRRPRGLDRARLAAAWAEATDNSPPFPTAGAALTSLLILTAKPTVNDLLRRLLGRHRLDRILDGVIGVVADGPEQVHCSEVATRLYTAAGLELRFVEPVLMAHMHQVAAARSAGSHVITVDRSYRDRLVALRHHLDRRATVGPRPTIADVSGGPARVASAKLSVPLEKGGEAVNAVKERIEDGPDHESDLADLILPADFERAEPFDTIGVLVRRRSSWITGEILTRPAVRA